MGRISYLRSSAGRAGNGTAILRPAHVPVWGVRRPALDESESLSGRLEAARLNANHSAEAWFTSKPLEATVRSTEITLEFSDRKAQSAHKRRSSLQADASFSPEVSADMAATSLQPISRGHTDGTYQTVPPSRSRSTTPLSSFESPVSTVVSQASSDDSKHLRRISELARQISELSASGPDSGQSLEASPDHDPDSLSGMPISDAVPESLASTASSARLHSQGYRLELPTVTETQAAANQAISNLRDSVPMLRAVAQNSGSAKQPDLKPSKNTVHIGSVDIHIHASPLPAVRPAVRQVVRPAAIAAMTRGFVATFGLNQG